MMTKHYFALALSAALASAGVNAGTIVNIQGYSDGTSTGAGYGYWVQVGATIPLQNPVLVNFAAGDYQISDAWGQQGALYDAWNFQATYAGSWASHYMIAALQGDGSYSVVLDAGGLSDPTCANHYCAWSTEAEASAAFLAAPVASLHLDQATTLAFVSADYALYDNLGGISLNVQAVPVPAAGWLFASSLVGFARFSRKRA